MWSGGYITNRFRNVPQEVLLRGPIDSRGCPYGRRLWLNKKLVSTTPTPLTELSGSAHANKEPAGRSPKYTSSIGATLGSMTSLPIQDGGPHDFRSKMAAPTTPRWRPPRNQDGGPCDAFGYTSEGESTP